MKYPILLCMALLFCQMGWAQDKEKIQIHCVAPVKLKTGQSVTLKVQVSHTLKEEKTGTLTLSLLNHETQKSVDGWFINIFPFQYFTTLSNQNFEAEFPFTVPNDYSGSFDLELVAHVKNIKDSIRFTVTTNKVKHFAKKS